MMKNVHDGLIDPQLLLITEEVYCHLGGYVNSQDSQVRTGNKLPRISPDFTT